MKNIESVSGNNYHLSEQSLYTVLNRLIKNGYAISYWGESDSAGRRKYYKITESGLSTLNKYKSEWSVSKDVIDFYLKKENEV